MKLGKKTKIGLSTLAAIFALTCGSFYHWKSEMTKESLLNSRNITIDNKRVEYRLDGEPKKSSNNDTSNTKIPILMCHGSHMGSNVTNFFFDEMIASDKYELISPSRPGYLGSEIDKTNENPAAHADMYSKLLDSLGIKKTAVFGWSSGGPSAMQMAIRHPDKVSKLILLGATTKEYPANMTLIEKSMTYDVPQYLFYLLEVCPLTKSAIQEEFCRTLGNDYAYVKNYPSLLKYVTAKPTSPGSIRRTGANNDYHNESEMGEYDLAKIKCPILLMYGDKDSFAIPHADYFIKKAEELGLNVTILKYRDGHVFQLSPDSKLCYATIDEFVNK